MLRLEFKALYKALCKVIDKAAYFRRKLLKKIILAGVCVLSFSVHADPIHPGLTDTWQFELGVFNVNEDATVSSTGLGDTKTEVTLDDSDTVPHFGARWRFSDKWALNLVYAEFSSSGSEIRNNSFNWDGEEYPLDVAVKLDLDVALYIASLDYAFSQSDTTEWGVGFGLHAIDFAAKLNISLNGLALSSPSDDFIAPLPNLRLYVRHAFSPKLMGSLSGGWMGAEIDEYDGELLVASAGLNYRFSNRWSAGINYEFTDIDLEVDDGRSKELYDVQIDGVAVTVKYSIPSK
jgi:hypothetical protein